MTIAPDKKQTRAFAAGRVVALVLIALAVVGLVYLHVASGDERVSVPKGAQAGDLILDNCKFETEDGTYAAECGTLVVPEDRAEPESRLIAVPVTRIKARSETPAAPIFRLEGGPGISNMGFAGASRFAEKRDVVLVGYRGVDGSVQLRCPEVESALQGSSDLLSERSFRAYGDAYRACGERLADDGVDVTRYGLVQQVDDLEAARKAFGYKRIDLLSESAGTRTALIYSWRYPESLHRSVMIGANPPGNFMWHTKTTNEQIARYAALCAGDEECSLRTDDLAASMRLTDEEIPDRWFGLPIAEGNVRIASYFGLMESTEEAAPASGPMTIDSWLAGNEGDASGFWFASFAADLLFPKLFTWGQYAAAASIDAEAARDYFASERPADELNLGTSATAYVWGGGTLADAWPAAAEQERYTRMQTSETETLMIGGALDFSTPPQVAKRQLLPYLPNGSQVVLPDLAHTTDFWTQQPEASARMINAYLDTGTIDDTLYVRQDVDLSPGLTQTVLAKGIAGTMALLAALTVLSLLLLAPRVRRHRLGRVRNVFLRAVYPVVLGLGGWFLGVLVVMTAMPGVSLDDERLATLSVGVPVGLGIYLAWVDRDRPRRGVAFVAAVLSGLVGAWLGFHSAADLLAVLTAITGAIAGANLALLLLDMTAAPQARERSAAAPSGESPEPHPSVS
jgi:pimeloyl-ACP methyl ester carboxylesterase